MTGMKKSMIVPEKVNPEIIAPPNPRHNGSDRVIGSSPMIVVSELKNIGSTLEAAASVIASINFNPTFRFWFIFSTITIELFTAIPNKAKIPIKAGKDKGVPVNAKMINTPEIASGITIRIIKAFL